MAKVILMLPDGFEEIEAFSVVDVLRRAGTEVFMAGMPGKFITSAHGIKVNADGTLENIEVDKYDGIVLPGGNPGYLNLMKSRDLTDVIVDFAKKGKLVAAICGSPLVLAKAGILKGKRATIAPGMEKELDMPRNDKVIIDGNIITSQGPGTAMEFALKIVEVLHGKPKAMQMKQQLVA